MPPKKRLTLHRDGTLRIGQQEVQPMVTPELWAEWTTLSHRVLRLAGELLGFDPSPGLNASHPATRLRALASLAGHLRAEEEESPSEVQVGSWIGTTTTSVRHRVISVLPDGYRTACGAFLPRVKVGRTPHAPCRRCALQGSRKAP